MAEQAAQKALAIVKKLAKKEGQPIGERHLPQRELQQCSGLCFTFVKKAGVGVTVETGSGFVIAKRGGSWSAPLFISVYAGGIGLSLGYSEIDSLIVLDTPEAVKRYAANQTDVATDIAAVGPLGKVAGQDSVSLLTLSDETFPYSVSHGTLVDLSYKGMRYRLDAAANRELYGAEATPELILGSESSAPEAFKPLFDVLSKYLETGVIEA